MAWNRQRRQLNVRLVVALVLCALLLPIAIQLAHLFQVTRSARVMLFRAEKALADGKVDEAIRCYKYYVNYQPDDRAVFTRLAILSTDRARGSRNRVRELWQAYPLLEQAAHHEPENVDLARRLVDVSLELGRLAAAVSYLDRLAAASPRDADLQFKLGRCLVAVQDFRRAIDALRKSISLDPKNVGAYVELANVLRDHLSRTQQADDTMEQLVKANPKSAKAYLERAQYGWRTGRREMALQDIGRAGALAPDDMEVLLAASDFALQRNDYATAQKQLDHAKRLTPDDDRVDRLLVTLRMNLGQIEEAIALLQKVIERNPDDARSLLTLCDLQLRRSDVQGARATMHRMEKARFARHILEYFEARILMVEGRWREACDELEQLRSAARRTSDITKQINLYLAVCYEQLGLPDRQMETYQRLVALDPNLLAARVGLAAALFQAHKTERALEEHQRLLAALRTEQFVRFRPLRNNYYQLVAGQITRQPAEQRDWTELERFVTAVEQSREVDPVEAVLMRADLLNRQGKADAARALLAAKEQQLPKELRIRTAHAILAGSRDPEKALAVLTPANTPLHDTVELRLARAGLTVRLGTERAVPLLRRLEEGTEKFSRDDQIKLWQGLGNCYYQLRDRHHTKRFWRRVADARPDDRQIRMLLFDTARESNDEAGMLEALGAFEKLLGRTSAEWKYCEAARLIWQVRNRPLDRQALSTAARWLKQAGAVRPMWQRIPCLEAELAIMEGRLDEALVEFRRASDIAALNPADLGQYVRLLYVRGRYELARELMQKMTVQDQPAAFKMLGSELEIRAGNRAQSLELAAAALESQNPIDHQWYGQFLMRAGRPAEAEVAFRRAVGLGPQIPELWLSLIQHLAATGKRAEALEIIRSAQLLLPEDRVPLILGQSFEALGDLPVAEQYYVSGAALYPDNFGIVGETANFFTKTGRLARGVPYLEQLLAIGASRNSPGDRPALVWARRALATILANDGGYVEQEKAMKLLEENTIDGRLAPDDMVVKAKILSMRQLQQSDIKAVQLLEQARREAGRLHPRYQVLLSTLYDRTGRTTLAETQMIATARENPEDVRAVSALVQFLVRRQAQAGTIEPWLAVLERKAPTLPVTVGSRARLLVRAGQTEQAVALLQGMLKRPLVRDELDRARYVAGVLEEIKQYDAARRLLEELIAVDPGVRLDLAEMLGRQGAIDAGLDQCQQAFKTLPFARVMPPALAILNVNAAQAKPEQFRRVEAWFRLPGNEEATKTSILQLANLLDLQSRFPELIRVYQDFLARSDVSERERAVVYNNLVYLLAMQRKDVHNALEMIQQAITVLGPSPQLRDTRALALLANGQNREAVDELKQVVADRPSGLNYFHLAMALAATNDIPAAQQAMRIASKTHQLTADRVPALERDKFQELLNKLGRM
jgi:tetratricopeptide (TPR) repeat protein